ncbi:4975_t:CDS:2 [Entrophospora sp. SA101]|nr:4975_t:CDS:2 [Entrophospora sp. SA101]
MLLENNSVIKRLKELFIPGSDKNKDTDIGDTNNSSDDGDNIKDDEIDWDYYKRIYNVAYKKYIESNPVATQEDKEDEDAKKMNKIVGERWERIKNFTHRSNKRSSPSSSNNNGAVDDEKKDENSQSPPLKKFKTDLIPSASWFAYTSPQPNDHSDNNNVIINNSSSSYKPKPSSRSLLD